MSEYLSEEEQLEQLRSFWRTYGYWILAGILLAAGGYGGWTWYQSHARGQAEQASALYQSWLDAGDDAAKSLTAREALVDAAADGAYHGFVLLSEAAKAVEGGKLAEAEPLLREVAERSREPLLRNLAAVRLAAVLQGLSRGDEALKVLDGVSGAGFRTSALEMKGDIHMARDERVLAHAAYKAAFDALEDGQKDSLLEAKVANAAPVPGAPGEAVTAEPPVASEAPTAADDVVLPPAEDAVAADTTRAAEAALSAPASSEPEEGETPDE